jgi:hypothetical protein
MQTRNIGTLDSNTYNEREREKPKRLRSASAYMTKKKKQLI